jgi:uncharacterized protein with HEPN domain
MRRDWLLYVDDILESIEILEGIRSDISTLEQFSGDRRLVLACERCLEIIGEAAKHLPREIREKHSAVPWKHIIGMRDILAHGYFSLSHAIIWDTMNNHLGILKAAAEEMLASSGEEES